MLENADLYRAVPRELNLVEISFIVAEPHPFNQDPAFFAECIPDLGFCKKKIVLFSFQPLLCAYFLYKKCL
jgi:hypothetical protein